MKNMLFHRASKSALLLGTVLAVLAVFSCTKDFDSINSNPNGYTADKVEPSFQLANVFGNSVLDPGMHERMHQLTNDIFAQFFANEGFSTQTGKTNDEWATSYYNDYHSRFIANLNDVIRNERKKGVDSRELHVARIWRCWVYSRATDMYGDLPYFGAADGTGQNAPYDKQSDIYKDMLKELKEASAALNDDMKPMPAGQDYVYNNDVAKWKKFANSLRLRLALRCSQADPALAKTNAEEAIAAGVFGSADDACNMPRSDQFGWGYNYQNSYYYGWGSLAMSRSMEILMTGLGGQPFPSKAGVTYTFDDPGIAIPGGPFENALDPGHDKFKLGVPSTVDPRGPLYFEPSSTASGTSDMILADGQTYNCLNRWRGTPAGLSTTARSKPYYQMSNQARLGKPYLEVTRPFEVLTYHEVCFLLAEAAQRGWAAGATTQNWYEKGIEASMLHHGVSAATITAYTASTAENTYGTTVKWGNDSGKMWNGKSVDGELDKIITQKYIALFPDGGWEAWNDHRRLHRPALVPFAAPDPTAVSATNGGPGNYVKRITYPSVEALNNTAFYNQAVSNQGPDVEATPVWWDKD